MDVSPARIELILTTVRRVREGLSLTVKQFQRLLDLMAAASNVIPFGLLYMRLLQWWLKSKGFSPRGNPFRIIKVTRRCLRALEMWRKPWFLSQGPVLGVPCRRVTLWFLISTTREVCARAPYTSWRTRSLCGPRTSSSR